MGKQFIMHMLSAEKNLSPFDVNMVLDSGKITAIPYTLVKSDEIPGLVHDIIFSRSPKDLQHTGLFIGGRDFTQATEYLTIAKQSMLPPFAVSTFADPSGAFTLAASIVAVAEQKLKEKFNTNLKNKQILIFGSTEPVAQVAAVISAKLDAKVTLIDSCSSAARQAAELCNIEYGFHKAPIQFCPVNEAYTLFSQAEVIYFTDSPCVSTIFTESISLAIKLKLCIDIYSLTETDHSGLKFFQQSEILSDNPNAAIGINALTVGNVKYRVQKLLLKQMLNNSNLVNLDFADALDTARKCLLTAN